MGMMRPAASASDVGGAAGIADILQQDRELIASQARHHVARPEVAAEPRGNGHEQLICHPVAQAVVQQLEAIQVHEQRGEEGRAVARDS